MKKFLGTIFLFLLWNNIGSAEIYELNRCISMQESTAKYRKVKWSKNFYKRHNTIYYNYLDQPMEVAGSGGFYILDTVPADYLDEEVIEELKSEGYKKVKWRETSSYTIDLNKKLVTRLLVYTDEYLDLQREELFKLTELYKEKGIYKGKLKKNLDERWKTYAKKIIIEEFKIEKIVGNLLIAHQTDQYKYYPEDRFAIMINLEDLTVAYDQVKRLNNQNRFSFTLCSFGNDQNNENDKGGGSSGTAFFISNKGHLITNNHVVEGCSISKITYKNKDYDTELIATDKNLDLALLKSKVKNKSFINFSKKDLKKMQKIYVGGYPLGKGLSDDLKISSGIISSLKGFKDNSNEIQIDAAINPGNSGGPIINQSGELVAIAVAGLSKDVTEGINFGIKSSAAETFLKSNKLEPTYSRFSKEKKNDQLLELLEEATVYTYCN